MFDAEYFRKYLREDADSLKDTPPRVEILLFTGERFSVYQMGEIRDAYVSFQIYPQDPNEKLVEYPKEDRDAGMPRYRADLVVVPYQQIAQVRLSTGDLAKRVPAGFAS